MENKNNIRSGLILGILSAVAFGTYGTFVNLLGNYQMSGYSLTVILPFVLTIYFGIVVFVKDRASFKIPWKMVLFMAVLGFVGYDGQNYCLINAYGELPFGLVSAIMFCNTFLVMIGSRIVFGNKITRLKVGAGIVCTIGVALVLDVFTVVQAGGFAFNASSLLWVLGGFVTVAGSYVAMKYAMEKGISGLVVFFYMNLFGVLVWWITVYSPVQMVGEIVHAVSAGGLLPLLGYVIITCIISFHLWATSIEKVDPTWVAIAYAMDPVTEIVLGFVIFSQVMNIVQILGVLLIIAAVSFVSYLDGKTPQGPEIPTKAS